MTNNFCYGPLKTFLLDVVSRDQVLRGLSLCLCPL